MEITGEYTLPAPRQAVWEALQDPAVLRASMPGCETLEKLSDTEFTAKVTTKVGPVKAKFTGKVTLSDLDPPNGYTISGEGQGGVAGFAKGSAKVQLSDAGPGQTTLRYTVDAMVGGKIAQIGSRLIEGTARKLADEFFGSFTAQVAARAAATAPVAPAAAAQPAAPSPAPSAPREGIPAFVWIAGVVIAVALLLYFVL
ncbi:MAG: carbon monoxide dehydrogenase [Alphaproteobacteria bacterium]|nr:carbon monoxide dehydrogenase [Alphaproteobacteria bacterium]